MSRSLIALAAIVAAVALAPAPHAARSSGPQYVAPAKSGALFLVSGHGYGHGVGMGQWGAQGYAKQGYTYDQILDAYYPGTTLGQTATTSIRVLLASGKKKLVVSSKKQINVEDGDGIDHTLAAGTTTLTPALKLAVDGGPAQALDPPLTFSPASGASLTLGRKYRGRIVVDVPGKQLRAINVLPLQQYLYGVVTAEMPSSWLPAALQAQAVAARSYALAGRQAGAPYDVSAGGQAYLGVSAETPAGKQAVDLTAGQVLLYNGSVALTLFSSSTGGRTQSAADAFGPPGRPYLVSVSDPYDNISPWHDWGPVPVTGTTLASSLGVVGRVVDATVKRNALEPCEDAQGDVALERPAAHGHRRRRDRQVGARTPLDVVHRRRPLAAAAVAESRGEARQPSHAERRRAGSRRRGRAEVHRRNHVDAVAVAGDARRLPLQRQAEGHHAVPARHRR